MGPEAEPRLLPLPTAPPWWDQKGPIRRPHRRTHGVRGAAPHRVARSPARPPDPPAPRARSRLQAGRGIHSRTSRRAPPRPPVGGRGRAGRRRRA
eukprot:scaffold284180_cov32-Tisochrysis_lutea.AAC.1